MVGDERRLHTVIQLFPDPNFKAEMWHAAAEALESDSRGADRVIEYYGNGLSLLTNDDPGRWIFLHHHANALMERADKNGSVSDMRLAIDETAEAVALTPRDDPYHSILVANQADYLFRLCKKEWSERDFSQAVSLMKAAISDTSDDEPMREIWLTTVREEMFDRFEVEGSQSALGAAFKVFEEFPPGEGDDALRYQLAALYQSRHLFTGSMLDLQTAETILQQLSDKTDKDDRHYPAVMNLLSSITRIKARRSGSTEEARQAIEIQKRGLESEGMPTSDRIVCVAGLASALVRQYDISQDIGILNEAIDYFREAIRLGSDFPLPANMVTHYASALLSRYERNEDPADLDESISIWQKEIPRQLEFFHAQSFHSLAWSFSYRARRAQSDSDWDSCLEAFYSGAMAVDSPPLERILAAKDGGYFAFSKLKYSLAKEMLTAAIDLLPMLTPRYISLEDRQYELSWIDGTVWLAVSAYLACDAKPIEALQVAEKGRGILDNPELDFSCDMARLESLYPDYYERVRSMQTQLHHDRNRLESMINTVYNQEFRELTEQFHSLVSSIRAFDGFHNFLLSPEEEELQELASVGPIVMFSVSGFRSDALLITSTAVKSLRLPQLTGDDLIVHYQLFLRAITSRSIRSYSESTEAMNKVLRWLWDVAISPVLEWLGFTDSPIDDAAWPRVWWVRAGLFTYLPLHAAGYHDEGRGRTVLDRVISSYVPTLKCLQQSRHKIALNLAKPERKEMLVVGMPSTTGEPDLDSVNAEMSELQALLGSEATFLTNRDKREVLDVLEHSRIVHFSCHGMSEQDPFRSRLLLNDHLQDPLTVKDIRSLRIQSAELAFLSACHSGTSALSGFYLPDENIHLSTAFVLAGFPSVIATMWYVYGDHSAVVAREVYSYMVRDSVRVRCDLSAKALHFAVRNLRKNLREKFKGKVLPDDPLVWAGYIHSGV